MHVFITIWTVVLLVVTSDTILLWVMIGMTVCVWGGVYVSSCFTWCAAEGPVIYVRNMTMASSYPSTTLWRNKYADKASHAWESMNVFHVFAVKFPCTFCVTLYSLLLWTILCNCIISTYELYQGTYHYDKFDWQKHPNSHNNRKNTDDNASQVIPKQGGRLQKQGHISKNRHRKITIFSKYQDNASIIMKL